MCYVPARPAAVRQQQRIARSATRISCRGCVGVRRRTRSVQCSVHDVARRHGARAEGGARGRCRRPHLRHRRVVRGELVVRLCILARREPAPIRADSVRGPVRRRCIRGGAALPVLVRDGRVGAADEQRHGGFGAALVCRNVQRCGPAGRRTAQSVRRRPTAAGRAAGEGRTRCCCSRRRARRAASRRSRDGRWPPPVSGRSIQTCSTAGHCGRG